MALILILTLKLTNTNSSNPKHKLIQILTVLSLAGGVVTSSLHLIRYVSNVT